MRRLSYWIVPLLTVLAVAGFLSLRGHWLASAAQVCAVCRRPVQERTRTVGEIESRRDVFCCPACALTAHRQSGRQVHVLRFTDFDTGAKLAPERAFLVSDSDLNLCARAHVVLDDARQPHAAHFDRCSPSILAFATKEAAATFAASHGGKVEPFNALAAAYSK